MVLEYVSSFDCGCDNGSFGSRKFIPTCLHPLYSKSVTCLIFARIRFDESPSPNVHLHKPCVREFGDNCTYCIKHWNKHSHNTNIRPVIVPFTLGIGIGSNKSRFTIFDYFVFDNLIASDAAKKFLIAKNPKEIGKSFEMCIEIGLKMHKSLLEVLCFASDFNCSRKN
jgi:hypothetical protein